ncbi:unnamed protein product [Prorocentrum cordatum]|uniref:Solute carrier family 40 protein n=1 Tax=Prorocentrum cordatum TaxID=2364126 RepID=A0ABN9TRM0_9DINO|nr:unnamed protein product [Polarella glacialis]
MDTMIEQSHGSSSSSSGDDLPDESTPLVAHENPQPPKAKSDPQPERQLVESTGLGSFQPAVSFLKGGEEDAKPIKYSDDVGTFRALTHFTGTVLESGALWRTCAVYWAIAVVSGVVASVSQAQIARVGKVVPDFSQGFETMANYFTGLLGIMTSMFVVTLFGRWWKIRAEGIGGLWGAIDDLIMILSIHRNEVRPYKERILRLGLLSHRLVYAQAQGLESREHLEKLVQVGLVTTEELDVLDQDLQYS